VSPRCRRQYNRDVMRINARKIFLGLPFLICAGLFGVYLLLGYFAVDPLAKRLLPWVAENRLASRASVGRVDFDPLRLAVTIDDFRLTQPGGAPLAGFKRLHLDLEASGLLRFAWKLRDIRLTAPQVRFDIAPGGKLNWADLIAAVNKDKTPPSDTLPRVLIEHLRIEQGDIEYTDRNRAAPFKASLLPLDLKLDGLSTLPEDRGNYSIAASLPEQGGTLKWRGNVGLNPIVSHGVVALEGVKLANFIRVVKHVELPLMPTAGVLNTQLTYNFAMVKDRPQAVLTQIALNLKDFAATLPNGAAQLGAQQVAVHLPRLDFAMQSDTQLRFKGLGMQLNGLALSQHGKPLLSLPQGNVSGVDFDLAARRAEVAQVALNGGEIHGSRNAEGLIDWQQVLAALPKSIPPAPRPATPASASAPFLFNIGAVQIHDWQAHYLDQHFRHALSADMAGFNLDFAVSNASGGVVLSAINSRVGPITLSSALDSKPAATLQQVRIEDGALDLAKQSVTLHAIVASGLRTEVIHQANQPLAWQAMFEPLTASPKPAAAHVEAASAEKTAWTLALQRAALEDAALHFEDQAKGKPVMLDIEHAAVEARDVSLDLAKVIPLNAAFQVKQGGRFDAQGTLAPEPLKGDIKLRLTALSLKPFAPYINRIARLDLNDGSASTDGTLRLLPGKALAMKYTGGFALDRLAITEEQGGGKFLGWQRLSSNDLTLRLAPDSLHIGTLRAVKPYGKIIIFPDKTLNVARMLRSEAPPPVTSARSAAQAPAAPARPVAAAPVQPAKDAFPVSIERLRIDNADLEFADLSLTPQFGTNIHSLSGVINGLSTNPATVSQVELDGKVDDYGSARIRGSLQPFHATDFTDLKLTFRNLEMNRLTPYSGKFAGRKIESGKLSVDLEYKVKNRQLTGENQFIVNKLRLGERVDSPDATKLPLDLAIALLEDSNGVIDLNLPVSGSLDDPQFSYARIVWKAIVNVLTKLVTAPFRALGNLLGISSEKLQAVAFDPGSAALAPPELEKLKAVAQAMSKRPALTLTVEPSYASAADTRAIEEQWIRRDVAQGMRLKLAPDEAPGPVDITNPEAQQAVLALAKSRLKPDLFKRIKAEFSQPRPDGRTLYAALLEQLTLQIPVTEGELLRLAQQRGDAIRQTLLANGVAADHLSVAPPVQGTLSDQAINTKMSLGAKLAGAPDATPADHASPAVQTK